MKAIRGRGNPRLPRRHPCRSWRHLRTRDVRQQTPGPNRNALNGKPGGRLTVSLWGTALSFQGVYVLNGGTAVGRDLARVSPQQCPRRPRCVPARTGASCRALCWAKGDPYARPPTPEAQAGRKTDTQTTNHKIELRGTLRGQGGD